MKIVLLGSSQLVISIAWAITHSELAQEVVLCLNSPTGIKQANRSPRNIQSFTDSIEDVTIASAMSASDTKVTVTNSEQELLNADVVVILPTTLPYGFRTPQSVKTTNLSMARQFIPKVKENTQNAIVLVAMPYANYISAWIHQTYQMNNIISIVNGISTAHLKSEIATHLGLSVKDVTALAIGNDEVTYPLTQYCRINGIPLNQLIDDSVIQNIMTSVEKRCPYTSANEYTLTSHILQVLSSISLDKKRVMSVGTLISADTTDVFINVPCKIGSDGIENIIPLELTEVQTEQFKQIVAQSANSQKF